MKVFEQLNDWLTERKNLNGQRIGFVPTMGNLHQGHLALCQRSLADNDLTVVSIFVNPTQFNNANDLEQYPKTLDQDIALLKEIGVDYLLLPSENEIYPDNYRYKLSESMKSLEMEGQYRPGHFDGVLTVVFKLLNLVQAQNAYFGEKDYQQYQLIHDMAEALFLPCNIIACPIVRDEFGLALSSRNNRLDKEQLAKARQFAQIFHQGLDCISIKDKLIAEGFELDYIEESEGRRFGAVYVNNIRLIDNYRININR